MPHRTIRPPAAVDLDTACDSSWLKATRISLALMAASLLAGLLSLLIVLPATQDAANAALLCDKYAAPSGSVQKLVDSLSSGQVGCLRDGTYTVGDGGLNFRKPGITLRSAPNARATLKAHIYVPEEANRVRVMGLRIAGTPHKANVLIFADNTRWLNNNITNGHRHNSCFLVGGHSRATGTLIQGNRIHDCGELPRTYLDHGIYVANAVGTVIRDNRVYDNADRGIQLYPRAYRTLVEHNIISRNGQGVHFAGSSSNNTVRHNIIVYSATYNVYAAAKTSGSGNLVERNCLWKRNGSSGLKRDSSFTARNNVVAKPASSRCRSVL